MNTIECIKTRRSIRQYTDQPVSRELLKQVAEAASYAPSWKNTQVTRYIIVDDPALKEKIAHTCCAGIHNEAIILNAPVLVATAMVKNRSGYERDGSYSTPKEKGWQMYDCGAAGQTFCLAAHELGLSTLIMGLFDEEKASALLELPENLEICALISVGYAAISPEAPKRKSVDELVTFR